MSEFVAEYPEESTENVETKPVELEVTTEEQEVTDPYEVKAIEQGWKPKDEWEGDPSEWRDAKEFVERGELFDKISDLNNYRKTQEKRVSELEKALRVLGEHNKKIAKIEQEKALNRLKSMKADALEDQDHEAVVELDDKIADAKAQIKELDNEEVVTDEPTKSEPYDINDPATYPEEVVSWLENDANKWYMENAVARGAMNAAAEAYAKKHYPNGEPDYNKVIKHAEQEVRKAMPGLFANPNRQKGSVSEPSGKGVRTKTKTTHSVSELSDEQRTVMNTYVREGVMTAEEYISQLAEIGEL
jgi:regulator of replication initiation timing